MSRAAIRLKARGFALLEMLFCIFAVSMILVVSARLFHQVGRVFREAPESINQIQSDQQWLQRLRQDAWGATDIRSDVSGALTLTLGDVTVQWSSQAGFLQRHESGELSRWQLRETVRFEQTEQVWQVRAKETSISLVQALGGAR